MITIAHARKLSDGDKRWLLKNCCRPSTDFKYPIKIEYGKSRSFQHAWLKEYPFLSYSASRDGGFCVICILFNNNATIQGQLVTSLMVNFTRAKQTLREHRVQLHHKKAAEDVAVFLGHIEGAAVNTAAASKSGALTVEKNKHILTAILKTIVFCAGRILH